MFRSSLQRLARPAGAIKVAPIVSQTRLSAQQISTRRVSAALQSRAPLYQFRHLSRAYSTESAQAVRDAEGVEGVEGVAAEEGITLFKDLKNLNVNPNLLEAITKDMRYERMTPVQAKTINPALKGTDIVAQAKTGTGKTLAFLLPLLNRMIQEDPSLASRRAAYAASSDDIRGIVLSPTRELAEQIATEAKKLVRHTGLVVQTAVGGTSKGAMLRQTQRQGCHLLVGTPGRLNDLLQDDSSGIDAPNLAALVLDEADRMLDVGFEKELGEIIRQLPPPEVKVRQTMLVSATIPDDVIRLARSMVRPDDFEFVQTISENESLTHDRVPQKVVQLSSWANIMPTLFELMDREAAKAEQDVNSPPFKAIVYFNTTSMVELVGDVAYSRKRDGLSNLPAFTINSKLSQMQRTKAADNFRKARSGILISSDVTARGMDFPNVTHVIQVDTPRAREDYVHRLGRTGRQEKNGEGWLLLPPGAVRTSRKMLAGLPIKPDTSLENAVAEIGEGELSKYHQEVQELVRRAPRNLVGSAYTSLFGVANDKNELARDMHHWITRGLGWPAPPRVSERWARNLGLDFEYLNLDQGFSGGAERFADRERRSFKPSSERRGRGDAFDQMSRSVRRDDDRSSRYSRNRSNNSSW